MKQSTPWFGTPFTTQSQEMEWGLFLQPRSPLRARVDSQTDTQRDATKHNTTPVFVGVEN